MDIFTLILYSVHYYDSDDYGTCEHMYMGFSVNFLWSVLCPKKTREVQK